GVTEGRLLLTTSQGIRALDAANGGDQGGWYQPATGKLAPWGRGLLGGGWVLWPTRDPSFPVRALNTVDGSQESAAAAWDPVRLRQLLPGNLAFADGCLVVAGADELVAYR